MQTTRTQERKSWRSEEFRRLHRQPLVTFSLVMLTVIVMSIQIVVGPRHMQQIADSYGLVSANWSWLDSHSYLMLITWPLIHGNALHFSSNMVLLLIVGVAVEPRIGGRLMLVLWIAGGAFAGFWHLLIFPSETLPLIGASGAISVVLGVALISCWRWKMPVRLWPGGRSLFSVSLRLTLLGWVIVQVVGIMRVGIAPYSAPDVAYWSHLAGFCFGVVCFGGALLLTRFLRPTVRLPRPQSAAVGD